MTIQTITVTVANVEEPIFGSVVDRINMLKPNEITLGEFGFTVTETQSACNFVYQWVPEKRNSFTWPETADPLTLIGSTPIMAPNGSMTARKISDAATTGSHALFAGFKDAVAPRQVRWRLVLYAKAAGRTRIRLEVSSGAHNSVQPRTAGVRATYDLAGGTVAIAPAVYGSVTDTVTTWYWTAPAAAITDAGGGWYKCQLEAFSPDSAGTFTSGAVLAVLSLDAGAGAAASNTSYLGDGVSGVEVWASRLLPARAFNIAERTFFDDFDSISTIDVNDTKAPGFKWYPSFLWPTYEDRGWSSLEDHTQPDQYTVHDSMLTLLRDNSGQNYNLATACWDLGSSHVGQTFTGPAYFEARIRWGAPDDPGNYGCPTFWMFALEFVMLPNFWSISGDPDGYLTTYHPEEGAVGLVATAPTPAGSAVLNFAYVSPWARNPGTLVYGDNIPSLTKVVSGTSTTITIDKPVTGTGVAIGNSIRVHNWVELDFIEVKNDPTFVGDNQQPYATYTAWPGPFNKTVNVGPSELNAGDQDFHVYALLWLGQTDTEDGLTVSFRDGLYYPGARSQYSDRFSGTDVITSYPTDGVFTPIDNQSNIVTIGGGRADGGWPADFDYVAVYGGSIPEVISLSALLLSTSTLPENSVEGTVVGTIMGATSGSAITMTDTAGGRFKLVGNAVQAGATATDYETATSHNITLRETLATATNSPRDTVLAVTVSDVVEEVLAEPTLDLNFAANTITGAGAFTDVLLCQRASTGYAETAAGTLTSFASEALRRTDKGLLAEEARTNVVLWNRDLTNVVWTKTNITAAKDQTGPDGVANSASSLTATAADGTCLQSITLASSALFQSVYVKRITGSGVINMTMDNGATWSVIPVTSSWARVSIPAQTLVDPRVGFRIVTSGDAIAVDFVQLEAGAFATSPIPTTTASAARAAEIITAIGTLDARLDAAVGSVVANLEPTPPSVIHIVSSADPALIYKTSTTSVDTWSGASALSKSGLASHITTAGKYGYAWDATGRSLTGQGLAPSSDATGAKSTPGGWTIGGAGANYINTYMPRLRVWDTRLSNANLQSVTT